MDHMLTPPHTRRDSLRLSFAFPAASCCSLDDKWGATWKKAKLMLREARGAWLYLPVPGAPANPLTLLACRMAAISYRSAYRIGKLSGLRFVRTNTAVGCSSTTISSP